MNDKTFQLGARVESLPTWALREFIQNAGSKFNARDKQLLVKEAVRLLSQGVERKATTAKATTALERRFPLHPQGEKRKTMARRRLQRLTDKVALNAMEDAKRAARNYIYYRCNGRLKAKKAVFLSDLDLHGNVTGLAGHKSDFILDTYREAWASEFNLSPSARADYRTLWRRAAKACDAYFRKESRDGNATSGLVIDAHEFKDSDYYESLDVESARPLLKQAMATHAKALRAYYSKSQSPKAQSALQADLRFLESLEACVQGGAIELGAYQDAMGGASRVKRHRYMKRIAQGEAILANA
jgi:hypothetical protein